jgi:hypothetical protein
MNMALSALRRALTRLIARRAAESAAGPAEPDGEPWAINSMLREGCHCTESWNSAPLESSMSPRMLL